MPSKQPIIISDDARKHAVASIRRYFAEHLDDEIGDLKATLMLDYSCRAWADDLQSGHR